jgi:hypothetical protein
MLQPNHVENDPVILQGQNNNQNSFQINPQIDPTASSLNSKVDNLDIETSTQSLSFSMKKTALLIGDTREFWVNNWQTNEYYKIVATLKTIGTHSLIYSNLSVGLLQNSVYDQMNFTFETEIYPTLTEFFGTPTDVDSNGKIIILVFDILDGLSGSSYVAGYFDPNNQYPQNQLPGSTKTNEAEIINIDGAEGKSKLVSGNFDILSHEFQHLIHHGNDDDETAWLNEGASMFAEYLTGADPFSVSTYKTPFRENPDLSLTYWNDYKDIGKYGVVYAFFLYLAEKYGGSDIVQMISLDLINGIKSVEQSLRNMGYAVEVEEVFRNWTIANYLDDPSFANGSYGYYNTTLSMDEEAIYSGSTISRTENSVPYWGTDFLKFTDRSGQPFHFEFQGETRAGYLVTAILSNASTLDTMVVPVEITMDNFGNFSLSDVGISAEEIVIVVSSYTQGSTDHHSDEAPAPPQNYWFMINPTGVTINPGNMNFSSEKTFLNLLNITVSDQTGFTWQETEGATYDILTVAGNSTGITGNLTYNNENNYWESETINITSLLGGNETYRVKYHFFNSTSSGITFSASFSLGTNSSTSDDTNESSTILPLPGYLFIMLVLSVAIIITDRRKKK